MYHRLADLKCFIQDLGSHKPYLTESDDGRSTTNTSRSNNLFSKTRSHSGRMPASLDRSHVKIGEAGQQFGFCICHRPAITPRVFIAERDFLDSCLGK